MTEVMGSVTGVLRRVIDKIFEKLQEYTLDRLVWCLVAIGFCWCEVQNYHEYIFWQRMWIMAGLGTFYCLKLGCFQKGKRIFCAAATLIGAAFTVYAVHTNMYYGYHYNNLPIGVLTTVTLNLYVLVIYDCIKERRFPFSLNPSMVLILMIVAMQFSVYDYRQYYLYILISFLPYIMMKKGVRTRSCMLKGMLDGMCIGFFLVQGYAWMHRPYNYSAIRYTGISNDKTTMARIYLAYYAVWIIQYVQCTRKKLNIWNGICRAFTWFMAAFVLALVYLTGNRSVVLAIMLMTAIAIAVRYYRPKEKWYKRLGKFGLWGVNCVCVGLVSLALFPTAYTSVRYLPAYFNEPDYVDSIGYRLLSRPIQEWGESFGWDFEYDEYAVKKDDGVDNPLYTSFAEAVSHNLGRIIPGGDSFMTNNLANELLESKMERIQYYVDQGYWIERYYIQWSTYYQELYDVNNGEKIVDSEKVAGAESNTFTDLYKKIVEKILSIFVLRLNASGVEKSKETVIESIGDSEENPWFEEEEFPGYGMQLRMAIHKYTIGKLNYVGHTNSSFGMWVTATDKQPHAHNIFLITGYDFGIPTMILIFLLFVVTLIVGVYNMIRFYKVEYLLPVLLLSGMIVFGWFESGFNYKSGMFVWIILCVIFTDVLHVKKKEVE